MPGKDITGQKFGRLTALSFAGRRNGAMWACVCECGAKRVVSLSHLRTGHTKSCGCWSRSFHQVRLKKPQVVIDQETIRTLLHYEPTTGLLTWKTAPNMTVRAGDVAGAITKTGYRQIQIGGRQIMAHRLIWLWMMGHPIPKYIDHKDGQRDNNRWENIRAATASQNGFNRSKTAVNTTGFKGVTRLRSSAARLFQAQIEVDGRTIWLGVFETAEEAGIAYDAAAQKHHGEFYRCSF